MSSLLSVRCPGPRWTRRTLLQAGALPLLGIAFSDLLQARTTSTSPSTRRLRGVILAHLPGGMSHLDTLDPKPDAPAEIRGSFKTIATSVPGVRFTEYLPRLAVALRNCTLIRSFRTTTLVHEPAAHRLLCGVEETPPGSGLIASRRDRPHLGALLARSRPERTGVPASIILPNRLRSAGSYPGQTAGFLGARYDPWLITGNLRNADFGPGTLALPDDVNANRLQQRRSLLAALDRQERTAASGTLDAHCQQAVGILTSGACRHAFDLSRESARLHDRYGRDPMGQGLLLGRRLIEAGVPLVQVNLGISEAWDAHSDVFGSLRQRLLPPFDRALSALLEDLTLRGLRDEVLVVVASEFGRAPRVGQSVPGGCGATRNGRDHWANVFSILAFGAGVGRGQVLGASDRLGAYPATASYTPADLGANILQALGVNPTGVLRDDNGQAFLVNSGTPIAWGS